MPTLLLVLAVFHGINGVVMLAAPTLWYESVPGVVETGPANAHFIRDIGLGFLAAAVALALAARNANRSLLLPAVTFLGGHAGLHLVEMITHGVTLATALRDAATVVLPGLLPLLALRSKRATAAGRA